MAAHFKVAAMNWQEFTALVLLAAAMSFTPGPNTMLSTALAANRGLGGAMRFVCAVPVGWGALLLLCATGVGALLQAVPALRIALKIVGIAYLVWLAWKLARSTRLAEADGRRMQVGFWQGVGLQFVNVKAWFAVLAIVAGWVAGHADAPLRVAIVLPVMVCCGFLSNLLYASGGALLRGWLAQGRRLQGFNRAMAALLLLTAGWMPTT